MVGNGPQVGKRPLQSPHAVKAKQIMYYINKDNKHICMLGALQRERSQGGPQRPQDPLETENTKKKGL